MSTELYLRFKGRKAFTPTQIPLTADVQKHLDALYPAADVQVPYPVVEAAAEFIREMLCSTSELELRSYASRKAWVEIPDNKKLSIGDLTFAAMDLPWEELCREAKEILEQFSAWKPVLSDNLFEEYDWRNYKKEQPAPPQEEPAVRKTFFDFLKRGKAAASGVDGASENTATVSETPSEPPRRTIREGLAHPDEAVYCRAIMLYQKLQNLLRDYPTMLSLAEQYALNAASDHFLSIQKRHDFRKLSPDDFDLAMANGFIRILRDQINLCNDLVACAEHWEAFLKSYPAAPIADEQRFLNATDGLFSMVAYTFVEKLLEQFLQLAQLKPALTTMVGYTLVPADKPNAVSADRLLMKGQLAGWHEAATIEQLQRCVSMRLIPALSFPEESKKARSHPDITSRMFFVSDSLAQLAALDFIQMCSQHLTARHCERCGKLFVPFGENAKYCERTGPNDGKCTCQKAAADAAAAKKREENIVHREYTRIGNRLNTGMTRKSISKADREEIMKRWRAQIEPIMEKAHEGMAAFDPESFEAELVAVHDEVRVEYVRQQSVAKSKGRKPPRY